MTGNYFQTLEIDIVDSKGAVHPFVLQVDTQDPNSLLEQISVRVPDFKDYVIKKIYLPRINA